MQSYNLFIIWIITYHHARSPKHMFGGQVTLEVMQRQQAVLQQQVAYLSQAAVGLPGEAVAISRDAISELAA